MGSDDLLCSRQESCSTEIEQAAKFAKDPRSLRGRIRDDVSGHEILIEINRMLVENLADREAAFEDIWSSPEETGRFLRAMPNFDVSVSLKAEYYRDPSHRWKPNDIHDIDALSSNLPYCDVVVTDKE